MITRHVQVAGYDASNELYQVRNDLSNTGRQFADQPQAFLSTEMQYSCPIWGEEEGGVRGDLEGLRRPGDLESAQRRKIEYILRKARLRPGDRLLEIGSGWGGVAIAVRVNFRTPSPVLIADGHCGT